MRNKVLPSLFCAGLIVATSVLAGTAATAAEAAPASQTAAAGIREKLERIPGLTVVSEGDKGGFPLYTLRLTQPVDHSRPGRGSFEQTFTLWHKAESASVVHYTGGYGLSSGTREITTLLGANQVSLEHRYFNTSRPADVDWDDLNVWQEASDEHAIVKALKGIYTAKWLGTGASKGGMTQVYHERYYPKDLDAVVAYVAPNDADNRDDSVYEEFFNTVGTAECRSALNAVQREMLVRRDAMLPRFEATSKEQGLTFKYLGTPDRAFEFSVLDQVWNFWQSGTYTDCPAVPDAKKATDDELYAWSLDHGLSIYSDEGNGPEGTGPYYRQAASQLGWADLKFKHLRDVRNYPGVYQPNSVLPEDMRTSYNGRAIKDVDRWVATQGTQMMFVYGQNDPWSAERFRPSRHDSHLFVAPDTNHGALISKLTPEERAKAEATVKRWAGQ
ncbi:S28 family serine protease [Streptomyces sp. H27-C3]|uniref:S28 family serine protease n=1 Tax=Streptomyces sp. H27-C3 TaxID=3046305 RepID=UPI0024BB2383|nr:S28 family serine protease [Streptomyces sp. H27-C3]MDJ0461789.1 S28 family serine protease [Streptomyces sp. H27-C3]